MSRGACYNPYYNWGYNMIEKRMIQVGNSWGVVIPKAIIDGLRINPVMDKVEIYLENNEVRIRKIEKK